MPATDDVEEQVGGACVTGDVAELVEHQQVWTGVALQASLGRGERFLAQQVRKRGRESAEADAVAILQRPLSQVLSQGGLADASRAPKEHVVALAHEVEGK